MSGDRVEITRASVGTELLPAREGLARSLHRVVLLGLRRAGLVALPEDLGVHRGQATRSLLAAKSMADLVEWSDGLYEPPARFRSW